MLGLTLSIYMYIYHIHSHTLYKIFCLSQTYCRLHRLPPEALELALKLALKPKTLNTNRCWKLLAGFFFFPPHVCKETVLLIKKTARKAAAVLLVFEMTAVQALLSPTAHLNLVK